MSAVRLFYRVESSPRVLLHEVPVLLECALFAAELACPDFHVAGNPQLQLPLHPSTYSRSQKVGTSLASCP